MRQSAPEVEVEAEKAVEERGREGEAVAVAVATAQAAYPYPKIPNVLIGRKNTLPTFQNTGHWRPSNCARAACSSDDGEGKSTSRIGTPMKDWVIALPC